MKKYFLHDGTESSGPFDFEDLIAKKITPKTPVWFEGMDKWKFAGEIPELNSIFKVSPPPFQTVSSASSTQKTKVIQEKKKILGLSKNAFLMALSALLLIIATIIFNTLDENRQRELDAKNHKTEVENYQFHLKEKEIKEEKIVKAQAEKAAAERALENQKEAKTDRIIEVDKLIAISQSNLDTTKKKLAEVSRFKVLRSSADKQEELNTLQIQIDSIYKDIDQLKIESNQLKLDLDKIP